MNNHEYENFKIYVSTMNENIANKLKNSEEELNFYATLVNRFNEICEEKSRLEQQCKKQKEVIDKKKYLLTEQGVELRKLYSEIYKLQGRINKAIEYLEEPNRDSFDYSKATLLDILSEVSE